MEPETIQFVVLILMKILFLGLFTFTVYSPNIFDSRSYGTVTYNNRSVLDWVLRVFFGVLLAAGLTVFITLVTGAVIFFFYGVYYFLFLAW